jgi:PAS domain S-box-containing protein
MQQAEELTVQSEELSQQVEEISQQSEELSVQNDELQVQSEEIQSLNTELVQREALLQTLLDAAGIPPDERSAIQHVCRSTLEMAGAPASAVVVHEAQGTDLVIRGAAGLDEAAAGLPGQPSSNGFVRLLIQQSRTASLNDSSLRPDLTLLDVPGQPPFRAVLGAPLRRPGGAFGAVTIYSREKHEWSTQQFRIVEWVAAQAAHILEILRLQEALRRHAALLDLTPDGIFVRRMDGTITSWGSGAERLYGYTKGEAIGRTVQALLRTRYSMPPGEIEAQLEMTNQWTGELVHTAKDGREVIVESRWRATRDERGGIAELLESNVDVTARKRAEEALRRANAELSEADRRKNEFLATLSHELRNPLVPIRYALEMLNAGDGPMTASKAKEVIDRQLAHMVRLVDDLLDVTRVVSNKVRLRTERLTLASVVDHAVEATAPNITQARHSLTVSLPDEPIWLDGDPVRLSQVLTNLLTNAVRYTPPGGRITLSAVPLNGDVVISVTDSGIGLTPEDAARIFQMFAQVGEPGHGGLGIGLALVKGLVELHGGTVEVHSAGPNRGSEFRVRLPRAAAPGASPECAEQVTGDGPRRRVLVVDDNVDSADMLKTFLEIHGHEVHVAYDGLAALATAARVRPDVGLFDIGLPGLSGYELAERLRSDPSHRNIYLIAVTGWGQDEDRERARASGFDAHLTKPTDPEAVRALLIRAAQRLRA